MKLAYIALAATVVLLTAPLAGAQELASRLFLAADRDHDGVLTRAELQATLEGWSAVTPERLPEALEDALPRLPQNQTPKPEDVQGMLAALPDKAPAKPHKPRRVLVLGRAAGYVHSSIPLAARTIEEMGKKTGAWSTTITYDAADINEKNLAQYDALFLDSTTGEFLDDPKDAAATAARRKALLDFIRGGKGLAGIHAASDSYHQVPGTPRFTFGAAPALAKALVAQGDKDGDGRLAREELRTLADAWYDKVDPEKTGRVDKAAFPQRFTAVLPPPTPSSPQLLGATGFPV
jgi:hypothetical protein